MKRPIEDHFIATIIHSTNKNKAILDLLINYRDEIQKIKTNTITLHEMRFFSIGILSMRFFKCIIKGIKNGP